MSTSSASKRPSPLAFVDCETTGLDPRHHHVWEVAVIRREDGITVERQWQVRPDLESADTEALNIGRYVERFAVPSGWDAIEVLDGPPMRLTVSEMLFDLQDFLAGCVMIGSNPAFDDTFLKKLLWAHGRKATWHYRTVDIATLAAGYRHGQAISGAYGGDFAFPDDYPAVPYKSYDLSRAVGIDPPSKEVAHTALGDARWAKAVYDAVTFPYRGGHDNPCAYAAGIGSACTCGGAA